MWNPKKHTPKKKTVEQLGEEKEGGTGQKDKLPVRR